LTRAFEKVTSGVVMKSASFLSSRFHNLLVVNLIFDVERFLRRAPLLEGVETIAATVKAILTGCQELGQVCAA